jgi:uncharacterized protein (DUF1684 family)
MNAFHAEPQEHEAAVLAWRRARLARLTAPDGWLSLIGRYPLPDGTSIAGADPACDFVLPADRAPGRAGAFERRGPSVRFTPAPGVSMNLLRGTAVEALAPGVAIPVRTDRDGPADRLAIGNVTLEVTDQPAGLFVRVRDPDGPGRRSFAGIEHYPIDPKWRVVATLERHEPPREIELAYESGSVERFRAPGTAAFAIDGVTYRVDPVFDGDRPRLYLVFRDETARDTTYGAGRFLYAPLPEGDRVLLDFNQAFSPPCAFTPYAACPLAPPQNRLALRVEAGEKRPR